MDWRDEGILLSTRAHGENAAIIDVLTCDHGRHAGVVRGGQGRRLAPILQPGTLVSLAWRARLEDQLGTYTVEPIHSRAVLFNDRRALAGLNAVVALLAFVLPERAPQEELFTATETLLSAMETEPETWPLAYLLWERALLDVAGYGLDLGSCAVTGGTEDLVYVSPRSGRAVSREGAGEWAEKLLPLPPALIGAKDPGGVLDGLRTTGHFLSEHLAPELHSRPVPEARARLIARLSSEHHRAVLNG